MPWIKVICQECGNNAFIGIQTPIEKSLKEVPCLKCKNKTLKRLMGSIEVYQENKHPLERIEVIGANEVV